MEGAMVWSFASIAFSNASNVQWAGPGLMKISVDAHYQAVALLLGLEVPDVLAQRLGPLPLALARLDVRAFEPFDVALVEHRQHGLDRLEERSDRLDMLVAVQHSRPERGGIGIVRNRVPGAEDQVLERGQGDEVTDEWSALLATLAEPDGTHLGDRTDGPGRPAADILHAGDERRCDRTQPHTQHPKLPLSRRDLPGVLCRHSMVLSRENRVRRA
jgi:hypothetical protein